MGKPRQQADASVKSRVIMFSDYIVSTTFRISAFMACFATCKNRDGEKLEHLEDRLRISCLVSTRRRNHGWRGSTVGRNLSLSSNHWTVRNG